MVVVDGDQFVAKCLVAADVDSLLVAGAAAAVTMPGDSFEFALAVLVAVRHFVHAAGEYSAFVAQVVAQVAEQVAAVAHAVVVAAANFDRVAGNAVAVDAVRIPG